MNKEQTSATGEAKMRPQDHEMELEPAPPNPEDACPVCDKLECECRPEDLRRHLELALKPLEK